MQQFSYVITDEIAGSGNHGNHLAQTVFYGLPEAGIGPAAFQNDRNESRGNQDCQQERSRLQILQCIPPAPF